MGVCCKKKLERRIHRQLRFSLKSPLSCQLETMDEMKQKLMGLLVAVLLHLVVAIALTQDSIVRWFLPRPKAEETVKQPEPKTVVSFVITPRQKLVAKEIVKPPVQPKSQYTRTSADQPQQKPKEAKFVGAHDTVAQSSAQSQKDAPKIAAVEGKDRKHLSSQSDFQDGKLKDTSVGKPQKPVIAKNAQRPAPPTLKQPNSLIKEANKPDAKPERDATSPLTAANQPLIDYLKLLNKKPVQPQSLKPLSEVRNPQTGSSKEIKPTGKDAAKQLAEKQPEPKKATKPTPAQKPQTASSKAGFRPQIDSTKNAGSIIRKGKVSSNDTEATPEGRYKQAVLDAIYKDWNRRMGRHPDLTLPGVLEIRWYVYAPGKVKGILPLSEQHGSAIQKGITFQSISQAKIPAMPNGVRKKLKGDPMEFRVTFYF